MPRKKRKTGLPPGSVVYTGHRGSHEVFIHYLLYNSNSYEEKTLDNQSSIVFKPSLRDMVDWYDVRGVHDTELIKDMGKIFNIHPLVLEDISDPHQRPKLEEYDDGIFIIIKSLSYNKESKSIEKEQVAIFFRQDLVVSFQETETDLFDTLRNRIRNKKGKIRDQGADYLVYAILDLLVDHYFSILDEVEEDIEQLERTIIDNVDAINKSTLHNLKRELTIMRKSLTPLREAVARFSKVESGLVKEETLIYARDLYDHTVQIMDSVDSYRDLLNGLYDLFLSEVNLKMNRIMQVLTLVATIFIPLTFLAGIYGMNFEYMPELQWHYGYHTLLAIMAVMFIGLLIYFKRKNWI